MAACMILFDGDRQAAGVASRRLARLGCCLVHTCSGLRAVAGVLPKMTQVPPWSVLGRDIRTNDRTAGGRITHLANIV